MCQENEELPHWTEDQTNNTKQFPDINYAYSALLLAVCVYTCLIWLNINIYIFKPSAITTVISNSF